MKWAIVFYALFSVNGEPVEHISWGLTFPHHEKCIEFFDANTYELSRTQINAKLIDLAASSANIDKAAMAELLALAPQTEPRKP